MNSPAVQWSGPHASTARHMDATPGGELRPCRFHGGSGRGRNTHTEDSHNNKRKSPARPGLQERAGDKQRGAVAAVYHQAAVCTKIPRGGVAPRLLYARINGPPEDAQWGKQ